MTKDKTAEVVNAIANLRDHGQDCECSACEKDKKTIASNPETAAIIVKLVK